MDDDSELNADKLPEYNRQRMTNVVRNSEDGRHFIHVREATCWPSAQRFRRHAGSFDLAPPVMAGHRKQVRHLLELRRRL